MIKILHVISDQNIGGAGRLLLNLLACGDRERFCFAAVVPVGSRLVPKLRGLSVKVIESNMSLWSLLGIIKAEKPQVVHTHAAASARVAARLCGVRVTVNTRHCSEETAVFGPCKRTAVRVFDALFTSCTVATAHYVKQVLMAEGIPRGKIVTVINGSRPLSMLSAGERARVRRELGYSADDVIVGMVARMEKGKGQEYFVRAASLCACHPRIKFLLAGEGTMEPWLREAAAGLGNLRFMGFLDDVTDVMNILDVNVNGSYMSETSSLSLSEGMSVGAVPLVTRLGGNPFMVKGCGVVVPPRDSAALARAIVSFAASDRKRKRLSERAMARFRAHFDASVMTTQTEKLYLYLLR